MSAEVGRIRLKVRGLGQGVHPIDLQFPSDTLDLSQFAKGLKLSGSLGKDGERLTLDLEVSSEGHFECTRCTAEFDRVIHAPVHLEFVPHHFVRDPEDENIHEYDPQQDSHLDITDDIRDHIALAVPMKHLCRAACAGLCPTCGKNLNEGKCECQPAAKEGQFSALKELQERLRAEELKRPGNRG